MMDKQRIYDAMLIRAWRKDVNLGEMWRWLRVYGISWETEGLKRVPRWSKMTVRAFVGTHLKPLSDRLWDTDPSRDVETLNMMGDLDCLLRDGGLSNATKAAKREEMKMEGRGEHIRRWKDRHSRGGQWGVTK